MDEFDLELALQKFWDTGRLDPTRIHVRLPVSLLRKLKLMPPPFRRLRGARGRARSLRWRG